jgi:hemolysin activation/secretion protein
LKRRAQLTLETMKPFVTVQLVAVLAAFSSLAAGQSTPNAGSLLQQVQPTKPPAPSSSGTGLTVEREGAAKLPPTAPFQVTKILISGNTLFDTAALHALVADGEGKSLTLAQINELAARITEHYRSKGYPLARAFIPAQTITAGVVRIEVIEARYGKVSINNTSRVNDPLLSATLSPLQSGQVIAQDEMDRALLLLSDIPGVVVSATLKPGDAVGTSDLLINTTPGRTVYGNLVLDNYGNRYNGRIRLGGTVNYNNPLHFGDVLSASGLSSGSGMNYGRLGYESLLNGQGTRLGGSYSTLHYELGEPLAALHANGTAGVASLWAKHPIVRSRNTNLYGQIQYDQTQLRDHVDSTAIHTDRHLGNWTLSLSGDARDALLSGGVSTWNLGWVNGRLEFDDAAAQAANAATAKTEGSFSKWTANLARIQRLGAKNSLSLTLSGQWANQNLDSSQKMSVGGPNSVRAYDVGVVSGDNGYQSTLEYRHELGQAMKGVWQGLVFFDTAHVTVNKTTWATGTNTATLSGAGLGFNWSGPELWSFKSSVATSIGVTPTLVGTRKSVMGWVEVAKQF